MAVVAVAVVAVMSWQLVERLFSQGALAAHMESGKAYAARLLERLGTLPPALDESSGVAVSFIQPHVLWSHNDSGDGPTLYAIDWSGRLLAVVTVANAVANDWEDIASGPCPAGLSATASSSAGSCLYVSDTGNNNRARAVLTIYVVVEPLIESSRLTSLTLEAHSFRFRYPAEPEDTEAIAVSPQGDVTVVPKGRTGRIDFMGFSAAAIARALTSREVLTAEYQGTSGITPNEGIGRFVTSAALSPDGRTLAVRTYNEVFFYRTMNATGDGSRWHNLERPCFLGDAEPQGEAIAYLDPDNLILTSEAARGRPGTIYRLQCQGAG